MHWNCTPIGWGNARTGVSCMEFYHGLSWFVYKNGVQLQLDDATLEERGFRGMPCMILGLTSHGNGKESLKFR